MLAKSFLATLLLFLLSPIIQAQHLAGHRDNLSLRGRVKWHTEAPIATARVELHRMTGETVGLVITNDDGQFTFALLSPGNYVISISCDRCEPTTEQVDLSYAQLDNHTVYVRNRALGRAASVEPKVSVRQLTLPQKAATAFRKGTDMLYAKHDFAGSLQQFQEALRHFPDYYEAYFQQGVAYAQMQKLDEATAAFEKALQLSGHRYAPALIGLATIANERGQYQQGLGLAQRGLELDKSLWQGHFELARAALGAGHLQIAEAALSEVRERNPQWPMLQLLYANLHLRKGDLPAMQASLEEFLRLQPEGRHSNRAREVLAKVRAQMSQAQPPAQSGAEKP